jgi:THAP domain
VLTRLQRLLLSNMVNRCVAYGCSNVANKEKGISMHKFPSEKDDPTRRKAWNKAVSSTRADWTDASRNASLCSAHFDTDQFDIKPIFSKAFGLSVQHERVLKHSAIPAIFFKPSSHHTHTAETTVRTAFRKRQHARVRHYSCML